MSGNKYVSFIDVPGNDLIFRNFAGRPTRFVPEGGKRTFTVMFDDVELADKMIEDGWAIRYRGPEDPNVPQRPSLTVKVNFNSSNPPIIEQRTSRGCVRLDEELVSALDFDEIVSAKMRVRGWEYEPGKLSAYLVRMEVEIQDSYADSYGHVDDSFEDEAPF